MVNKNILLSITVIAMLTLSIGVAWADEVTSEINYQGRLADSSGSPLSGTYTMTFRLYEDATGGTALATDTHQVNVTDGLFNTGIDFGTSYFDGRELWLGVAVGTDAEMTPRQELRPVPYAFHAEDADKLNGQDASEFISKTDLDHLDAADGSPANAVCVDDDGNVGIGTTKPDTALHIHQQSEPQLRISDDNGYWQFWGGADFHIIEADTNRLFIAEGGNVGIGTTDPQQKLHVVGNRIRLENASKSLDMRVDGAAVDLQTTTSSLCIHSTVDNVLINPFANEGNVGIGTTSPGAKLDVVSDGSSIGVRASSANSYGVYGEGGKYGGYFTTNQGGSGWDDCNAGVNATTTHDYSDGVRASTTGDWSDGVYAYTTGYDSEGVHASSANSYGVYGIGRCGGYFTTNQAGGNRTGDVDRITRKDYAGVMVSTDYDYTDGVHVTTTGCDSEGVRAYTGGHGSAGVYTYTSGHGSAGVHAYTIGDNSDGVYTYTYGDNSAGVHAYTIGDNSDGVYTYTYGDNSDGVRASTGGDNSDGFSAVTFGHESEGVYVYTHGTNSEGVSAYSNQSVAIYGSTKREDHKYGVKTPDKMCAHLGYDTGCFDVAEYFPTPEDPEPGTVMVIDPAGGSKLRSSTNAYDTTVAGIVSTAPGVSLGTKEDGNDGEKLIAVAGRVPCKVDASYAAIKPGDLLTTSDTQGHAMKATNPVIGTILGKALEPLDAGTGTIEVLVTLQ